MQDLDKLIDIKTRYLFNIIPKQELPLNILDYLIEMALIKNDLVVEESGEPLISMRDFCTSICIDGNMILFPSNITGFLRDAPEHFAGCYELSCAGGVYKVRRDALLEKLKSYKNNSRILKKYLTEIKKHEQSNRSPTGQD